MIIQFSDGRKLHVEDTGLSLEIQVEEQFVAPIGRCYLLSDTGFVVTDTVVTNEVMVAAGTYVFRS